jgi:RNA polymerase sigma-70 factor (family 1)
MNKVTINENEFGCIYKKYYEQLYFYAYGLVEDTEVCRDIVADTFEKAWSKRETLEKETISNFLYSCVRNKCIDHLRHNQAASQYTDSIEEATEIEDILSPEEREERLYKLNHALENLPEKSRNILIQHYFLHKKYKEMAEEMNISVDGVKMYITKALSALRKNFMLEKPKK